MEVSSFVESSEASSFVEAFSFAQRKFESNNLTIGMGLKNQNALSQRKKLLDPNMKNQNVLGQREKLLDPNMSVIGWCPERKQERKQLLDSNTSDIGWFSALNNGGEQRILEAIEDDARAVRPLLEPVSDPMPDCNGLTLLKGTKNGLVIIMKSLFGALVIASAQGYGFNTVEYQVVDEGEVDAAFLHSVHAIIGNTFFEARLTQTEEESCALSFNSDGERARFEEYIAPPVEFESVIRAPRGCGNW